MATVNDLLPDVWGSNQVPKEEILRDGIFEGCNHHVGGLSFVITYKEDRIRILIQHRAMRSKLKLLEGVLGAYLRKPMRIVAEIQVP